jgi:sugar phosphate isomerase/epimerase
VDRRTFLTSAVAASVFPLTFDGIAEARTLKTIGLQLYTVRFALRKDIEGTLAKVAAIGYREVEFAGDFDEPPNAVRAMLDRQGLTAPSAHVDYSVVEKKWSQSIERGHALGHKYLICSDIDEKQRALPDGWKRAAELFQRAGEAGQKAGIQFGYHNHTFEFQPDKSLGGKLPYDFLLAETDPHLVKMEMDLCWITEGRQDPLTYFHRYPGRFPLVHVKDITKDHHMTEVGSGAINWKRILADSDEAGIKHYIVEHDEPASPFESIRTSYEYLRKLEF